MPGQSRYVFPLITAAVAVPLGVFVAATASAGSAQPHFQPDMVVAVGDGNDSSSHFVVTKSNVGTKNSIDANTPAMRVLAPGVGSERGLQTKTILAARAISARFPQIREIGGCRPDSMRWHPEGLAIDVIVPDYQTPAGKALGDQIVAYALANAARWGLVHVIWQQTYMPVGGPAHRMADLGSPDANHYTHVHIATRGDGYPIGGELYLG